VTERLEQLLVEADVAVCRPPVAEDLAARVPRVVRGRRRKRAWAAAVLTTLVSVGLAIVGVMRVIPEKRPIATDIERDLKAIQLEADRHMEAAAKLEAAHPVRNRAKWRSSVLNSEVERAAMGLMLEADRIAADPALRATAVEFYRQVQAELPANSLTGLATQRLAHLRDGKDL